MRHSQTARPNPLPDVAHRAIVQLLLIAAATVAAAVFSPTRAAAQEIPPATKEALRTSDLIYVATKRKNGQPSAAKPIWFYYEDGDELFFTTTPSSWKAKRIAAGSPLFIHVGKADGPALIGEATKVSDPALVDRMGAAYAEKYWIAWFGLFKPRSARVTEGKTSAYVVKLRPE
jgi:general stress protein 26